MQKNSSFVSSEAGQNPHVLAGPLLPYKKSNWKKLEQVGAEMCQAQFKLRLAKPAVARRPPS